MRWTYRETVLTLCTLAFFVTMVGRLAISPVVPLITAEFQISNAAIGAALTGMWVAYFATQYPSGVLADRIGERRVILAAIGGSALATLALALTPPPFFALFVAGTMALGAVAGLHYSVATTLLTRIYDDIGAAIGFHNIGAPAAGLITPPIAAWVGVRYGWRPAIALTAVVAIPIFALFAWGVDTTDPRRPDEPMRDRFQLAPVLELLARPQIAFPVALAVLGAFVWQGTASFLPTFLVEHRNHSPELAGLVFAGYFVAQAITQVGVGWVSDHYGRDLATAGCMLLATTGLALLITTPGRVALTAGIVLLGTGLGWGAALLPRFMDVLSDTERGAGFGLVRTVYGTIGALGSVTTGLVADTAGWAAAFTLLAACCTLVLVALTTNWALDLGY